jgi:hypothetical protein
MSSALALIIIAAVVIVVALLVLLARSLTGGGAARRSIGASGRCSDRADLSHTLEMCGYSLCLRWTAIIMALTETYDFGSGT